MIKHRSKVTDKKSLEPLGAYSASSVHALRTLQAKQSTNTLERSHSSENAPLPRVMSSNSAHPKDRKCKMLEISTKQSVLSFPARQSPIGEYLTPFEELNQLSAAKC